jgi:hypothetical protein
MKLRARIRVSEKIRLAPGQWQFVSLISKGKGWK